MLRPFFYIPLGLLLLAGGCASYRPSPLDPAAELHALKARDVAAFVVERAKLGEGERAHSSFDPTDGLDDAEVVAVALTLNPELRAKRLSIGEAQALLIGAGLWPNPEVGTSLKAGLGGASGYSLDVDALFQLLRPGERSARKAAATSNVEAARAEVEAAERALVSEVRAQRVSVLAAERAVALQEEGVALRERTRAIANERARLGEATKLDTSASELELAESRRDLRKARADLNAQEAELARLMGLPPEVALKLTGYGQALAVTVFEDIADEVLDRKLLGHPELAEKQVAYRRAEAELKLAILGQYPRLGFGPAYEKELEGDEALGLGLSLEVPIFNQNQGEIAEKRASRERVRAAYTAVLHRIRAEAYAARNLVRIAKAEVDAQEREILPLINRNQELFEGAFRAGELSILNWITAQERALDARREYLDALVRYRKSVITLETAAGRPFAEGVAAAPAPNEPNPRN